MRQENGFTPAYLKLTPAEFGHRLQALEEALESCVFCPRRCRVNRPAGEFGLCGAPAQAAVSSVGLHFGEERELVGSGGSGTIFFTHCNLECVFCQNFSISRAIERGTELSAGRLADQMLYLESRGAENINLVTPTPYLYPICAALNIAAAKGLRLPVVYNCGGFEAVPMLKLLEGMIDIYMPDAKYGTDEAGKLYSGVPDYYNRTKEALKEMQRQVGDLKIDADGVARRGLLVRHLVMPEGISGSLEVARFLSEEVSKNCAVNVMAQYHPAYQAALYPALKRRITAKEYALSRGIFKARGLRLL